MINETEFEKIKQDSESYYKKIGKVKCPALNNDFVFHNSEGFNHLVYKGNRKERDKNDQLTKFKLLPKAKKLVEITTTYQEYEEVIKEIRIKKFKRTVIESKIIRYWGIIAIMGGWKIKVIIRQIGDNGQKHFWSVIPNWITSQYRDVKFISNMKGDPEND